MKDEDNFVRITLRLPKGMHEQLTEAAGRKRSMNAEIIARLEYTFEEPKRIAKERAQVEALLLEERKETMKRQAELLHIRMTDMANQLARIEAFMAEHDVKAKGGK